MNHLPTTATIKIISGGQSGADMAGLDAALEAGIPMGGTAPPGYIQHDEKGLKVPNMRLKELYGLREGKATTRQGKYGQYNDIFHQRTLSNVQEADGTVWFGTTTSPGAKLTLSRKAQEDKVPPLVNPTSAQQIADWINTNKIRTLNVAGNRECTNPGIYAATKSMMKKALSLLAKTVPETRMEYKYINFAEIRSTGKTSVWSCRNNKSGEELGQVKWHGPWRQYCYFPSCPAVYSTGCLKDIEDFIEHITKKEGPK